MLSIAILAVSMAAIFIRKADAHPLFIAFGRCAISTAVMLPIAFRPLAREWSTVPRKSLGFAVAAGVFLGAHFAAWIGSLSLSSVASCVVMANTTALWAALLTPLLSHDRIAPRVRFGILISFAGILVIEWPELMEGGSAWRGDLMALSAGLGAAIYMLFGRRARGDISIAPYLLICYSVATLVLLIAMLGAGVPFTGYSWEALGWIAALGLISQMIGHSTFNWALRWLPAAIVGLSLLAEPILTALWAWLLLSEPPTIAVAVGGGVVLFGVWFATRDKEDE